MIEADYSPLPSTSEHTYICTDSQCEYCYLTREKPNYKAPDINELPGEIRNLIVDSGGWLKFKAEVLLENSRVLKGDEIMRYKKNLYYANKLIKAMNKKIA